MPDFDNSLISHTREGCYEVFDGPLLVRVCPTFEEATEALKALQSGRVTLVVPPSEVMYLTSPRPFWWDRLGTLV